jgi:hypothetical protein
MRFKFTKCTKEFPPTHPAPPTKPLKKEEEKAKGASALLWK